jgi:hypothetical protein
MIVWRLVVMLVPRDIRDPTKANADGSMPKGV